MYCKNYRSEQRSFLGVKNNTIFLKKTCVYKSPAKWTHWGWLVPESLCKNKQVMVRKEHWFGQSEEQQLFCWSSRPEVFCKEGVLKHFAKFAGKHRCQSLFLNKVSGLKACNFIKKRPQHRCFPVNIVKFFYFNIVSFIKIETLAQVFSC